VRSIREIEDEYLQFLDEIFLRPRLEMERYGASPAAVANQLASKPGFQEALATDIEEFQRWSRKFWQRNRPALHESIAGSRTSTVSYARGVLDAASRESFRAALLHFDLLLIAEPFSRLQAQHVDDNFARLFATHALSLLALRPAIIDVRAPAIAIVPTFISLDPRAEAKLGRLIIDDVLLVWSYLFENSFGALEQVQAFAQQINTTELLRARLPERFRYLVTATSPPLSAHRLRRTPELDHPNAAGSRFLLRIVDDLTSAAIATGTAGSYGSAVLVDDHETWAILSLVNSLRNTSVGETTDDPAGDCRATAPVRIPASIDEALFLREEPACRMVRRRWREILADLPGSRATHEECKHAADSLEQIAADGMTTGVEMLTTNVCISQRTAFGRPWLLFAPPGVPFPGSASR